MPPRVVKVFTLYYNNYSIVEFAPLFVVNTVEGKIRVLNISSSLYCNIIITRGAVSRTDVGGSRDILYRI